MSSSLRLLTATDRRPNFLLNAEISPLTEPAGPYQSAGISQSMSIRERGYENKGMPFCPRPIRFVPGQKGGTERPGTIRKYMFNK